MKVDADRRASRRMFVALAATMLLVACNGGNKVDTGGTQKTTALPDTTGMTPVQVQILKEALSHYNIDKNERPPLAITDSSFPGAAIPESEAPEMTIATMTRDTTTPRPAWRLIARITSRGDYPAMGVYKGTNFIWRSSWNNADSATWVTRVVSTSPGKAAHDLHRDPRTIEYTHGDPSQPRLVKITVHSIAFAVCLDDPMCGSGHCGAF